MLGGIVVALQVGKVPPAIPQLRAELDLSLVDAGLVASVFALLGACVGIGLGALAGRLGPRLAMAAAAAALALGASLGAMAEEGGLLLAARILEGVGFVGVAVAAPRLIVLTTQPSDRALALGIWSTYMPVGMALAMATGGLLVELAGWRALWWAAAAAAMLYLVGFLALTRRLVLLAEAPPPPFVASLKATFRHAGPWLLAGCFGFYSLQFFAVTTWLPTFLIEVSGQDRGRAAQLGALVVATNILGNLTTAALLHRGVARAPLILTAYAVMAVSGFAVFTLALDVVSMVLLLMLFTGFGGLLPAAVLAGAATHAPSLRDVPTVAGACVQGANLGNVLGAPAMAAAVGMFGGWTAAPVLLIGCGAIGTALALWLGVVERRQAQRS